MSNIKPHWRVDTDRLTREIRAAAAQARTEEDLKLRIEPLFQRVFRDVGVDVDSRQYEKTTKLSGRMDAVYGFLVIEHKASRQAGRGTGESGSH